MTEARSSAPRRLRRKLREPVEIGWCELIDLPQLGAFDVHAKIDTGAATSSLYGTRIKAFARDDEQWVAFTIPRAVDRPALRCEAPVVEQRRIRSSNGAMQTRYVIETEMKMGPLHWTGHMTLANRQSMAFPVLVGRRALRRGFLVNSGKRWLLGKPRKQGEGP